MIQTFFSSIRDNRKVNHSQYLYPSSELLVLTILAVISEADSLKDVVRFGHSRLSFLQEHFHFKHGIPSVSTLCDFFAHLNMKRLESEFLYWTKQLYQCSSGDMIALDGKSLRGSRKGVAQSRSFIHMVNAWSSDNEQSLGHVRVEGKINEIEALSELIEVLNLKGATVTIDAAGTQRHLCQQLRDKHAHYVLALKGNQGNLHEQVKRCFDYVDMDKTEDYGGLIQKEIEKDHGRIETRTYRLFNPPEYVSEQTKWCDLHSIIEVSSERMIGEKVQHEKRYYISSHNDLETVSKAIRSHWGIENKLHWVLDMSFNEDRWRNREGESAENLGIIRQWALNLLRREKSKDAISGKRKKCAWDTDYLLKVVECFNPKPSNS